MNAEYWRTQNEIEIRANALEVLLQKRQQMTADACVRRQCPVCAEHALVPIGHKFHCLACGISSDLFQDGDAC